MKTVALELQPCCGKRSGIGYYTYELAKRMKSDGELDFCGVLFNFLGRNHNEEALRGIEMPIRESRLFPYGVYRRTWRLLPVSYQQLFPGKMDLSIFFNYIVPPRVEGKVITTVYDMTYLRYPETMDARNLRRLREGMARSVARSDRILTISRFSQQELTELMGVPEERIAVIPCAPSFSQETADLQQTAAKFGVRSPYILYVGTIEPRKNLVRLIHAFERLKEREGLPHQLVLAGGKGWQNEGIFRAVQESRYQRDILFPGYLSDGEKNALYQNAALFVFPSLYEGFGMPPLEAMHWGCPVVAARAASLPEVCGEAAQLVDPMDEESIAQGLLRVLTDGGYARQLREKGFMQEKKYTWEDSARRLKAVCKEVLRQ